MISYELANELREAGFPFNEGYTINSDGFIYPSLPELIDACGEALIQLRQYASNEWNAMAGSWLDGKPVHFCDVTSSTPEEAVARLYLALKKK